MNAELARKLAERRKWEDRGGAQSGGEIVEGVAGSSSSSSTQSRSQRSGSGERNGSGHVTPPPPPPPPPSKPGSSQGQRARQPPPVPGSRAESHPPPPPPVRGRGSSRDLSSRQPPPVPLAREQIQGGSRPPPLSPRPSQLLQKTGSVTNRPAPPGRIPSRRLPPPPPKREPPTRASSREDSTTPPPPPVPPKRGPDDYKKPRPSSKQFGRTPLVQTGGAMSSGSNADFQRSPSGMSTGSSGSLRPPAPGFNRDSLNASSRLSSQPLSTEERMEFASKGKAIFAKTISQDETTQQQAKPRRGSQKEYKFARVEQQFDPMESGYARSKSDSFLKLEEDDVVEITGQLDEDWWEGQFWDPMRGKSTGRRGKFPASYVVGIKDPYDPWDEGDDDEEEEEALPTPPPTEDEAAKRRHKKWRNLNRFFLSLLELITNEFKYVIGLRVCFDVYVSGINAEFGNDFVGVLFPSWQTITKTHEKMLIELSEVSRASWKALQKLGVDERKRKESKRESILVGAENIADVKAEIRAIGQELDAVQKWHDAYILDQDDNLPDELLLEIQQVCCQWCVKVAVKLGEVCEVLKASSVYIRNYNDAVKKLEEWLKNLPKFTELVNKLANHPKARGLNLSAYLIKPVQHICRYPLLIREVHKNAPDEKTQDTVLTCQIRLLEVTTEVNQMQEIQGDMGVTILDLQPGLRFKNDKDQKLVMKHLNRPTTQLLKNGEMGVVQVPDEKVNDIKTGNSGTTYACFLLNQCLLITDNYQNFLGKERYKVKTVISMDRIGLVGPVESHSSSLFAMSVMTKEDPYPLKGSVLEKPKKWVFSCATSTDRDSWIRNVEQSLSITRGLLKPTAVAPVPGETMSTAGPSGDDDRGKYNSLKVKQDELQNAHPSFLLKLQQQDPLINELRNTLKKRK